jgi:hypothetical protein
MELATTRQTTDPPASSVTIKAILTRSRILRTRPSLGVDADRRCLREHERRLTPLLRREDPAALVNCELAHRRLRCLQAVVGDIGASRFRAQAAPHVSIDATKRLLPFYFPFSSATGVDYGGIRRSGPRLTWMATNRPQRARFDAAPRVDFSKKPTFKFLRTDGHNPANKRSKDSRAGLGDRGARRRSFPRERHFSRYTPEMVERVTGCPQENSFRSLRRSSPTRAASAPPPSRTPSPDPAHQRPSDHRLLRVAPVLAGEHRPPWRGRDGAPGPRLHPGLDRRPDTLPLDPRVHESPVGVEAPRLAPRLAPHGNNAAGLLGQHAEVHGLVSQIDVRGGGDRGERLRVRLASENATTQALIPRIRSMGTARTTRRARRRTPRAVVPSASSAKKTAMTASVGGSKMAAIVPSRRGRAAFQRRPALASRILPGRGDGNYAPGNVRPRSTS